MGPRGTRPRTTIDCAVNRPTQDWRQFLGDVPATTAILDRFLAHAEIIQSEMGVWSLQRVTLTVTFSYVNNALSLAMARST